MEMIIYVIIGIALVVGAIYLIGMVLGIALVILRFVAVMLAVPAIAGGVTWWLWDNFWIGGVVGLIYPIWRTVKEGDLWWAWTDDSGSTSSSRSYPSISRSSSSSYPSSTTSSSAGMGNEYVARKWQQEGDSHMSQYEYMKSQAENYKSNAEVEERDADNYINGYNPDAREAQNCLQKAEYYYREARQCQQKANYHYQEAQKCYENARCARL